jgi:D-inositol-3-phosphate glycosyltransferase
VAALSRNVLIVSHYYPPHIGGVEVVASTEARGLASAGSRVTILTSACGKTRCEREHEDGVEVVRTTAWNGLEKFGVPFPVFGPRFFSRAWRWVNWADVVHIHDVLYISSWIAAIFCRVVRRPYVVTKHVGFVAHRSPLVRAMQAIVTRVIGRLIISGAETVIAINPALAGEMVSRDPRIGTKTQILVNGVDNRIFRRPEGEPEIIAVRRDFGLPIDEFLVLFVGRFVDKKRLGLLLDCESPAYRIVVVGGDRPADVRCGTGVVFLGALDHRNLARVYRAADILVCPSVGEFLPLSVLEAIASGLPAVVEYKPGYLGSEFADAGVITLANLDENLSGFLAKRAADRVVWRAEPAEGPQPSLKRFSLEAHMHELMSLYDAALVGHCGA